MSDPAVTANATAIPHDFRLATECYGNVRVVRVFGCLDWKTADEFRDLMRDGTGALVIVDLGATTRMDSAGTGQVLTATVRAERRGQRLVVAVSDPLLLEVLMATGLDTVVPVVASLPEALLYFGAQVPSAGRAD